jgi:hypothetical protein
MILSFYIKQNGQSRNYLLGVAVELAGKHRSFLANSLENRRVLSVNSLGKRLCRSARVGISGEKSERQSGKYLNGQVFLIGRMSEK